MDDDVTTPRTPIPGGKLDPEEMSRRVTTAPGGWGVPPASAMIDGDEQRPAVRPGWQTTEFLLAWSVVVAGIVGSVRFDSALMLGAAALVAVGYALARAHLKVQGEGKSAGERRADARESARVYERTRVEAHERWRARAHVEAEQARGRRESGAVEAPIPPKGV